MIEIKFPADNKLLALALGAALTQYGGGGEQVLGTVELCVTSEPLATAEPEVITAVSDGRNLDPQGVEFDPAYCSTAKDPFGQDGRWKLRRGVPRADFDAWHESQKTPQPDDATEPQSIDTAAALTGQQEPPVAAPITEAGPFMAWVSEQQVAGRLTADEIQQSYAACGVEMPDLFDEAKAEGAVKKVYAMLSQIAASK